MRLTWQSRVHQKCQLVSASLQLLKGANQRVGSSVVFAFRLTDVAAVCSPSSHYPNPGLIQNQGPRAHSIGKEALAASIWIRARQLLRRSVIVHKVGDDAMVHAAFGRSLIPVSARFPHIMYRSGDRGRERYDRGRPRSPEPERYPSPSNYRSPRSRSPDNYGPRSHHPPRSGGYQPNDAWSDRARSRSQPRRRSPSRGPPQPQRTPKGQRNRSSSRQRNDSSSHVEHQRTYGGPSNASNGSHDAPTAVPDPATFTNTIKGSDVARPRGTNGNANTLT